MRINIFNNELYFMGFDHQDWKEVINKALTTNSVKHVHVFLNGPGSIQKTYLNLMGTLAKHNSSKGHNLSFTVYTMGTVSRSYVESIFIKNTKFSISETMEYTKYVNYRNYFKVRRGIGNVFAIYYKPYKKSDLNNIESTICWSINNEIRGR